MKLTRPRVTVSRMMVAVAISAGMFALLANLPEWTERRRSRIAAIGVRQSYTYEQLKRQQPPADARLLKHYDVLRQKYYHAAQRPWLPVWPDPPEP